MGNLMNLKMEMKTRRNLTKNIKNLLRVVLRKVVLVLNRIQVNLRLQKMNWLKQKWSI